MALAALLPIVLAGCQSGGGQASGGSGKSASLRAMEQVAIAAHRCWFASKDPAFRAYRMANELNSFSGRIKSCLPGEMEPRKNSRGGRLSGVLSQGNGDITVKSHSGNVELCDR